MGLQVEEIIEFPMVVVDAKTFEPVAEFRTYVRPESSLLQGLGFRV